MKKTSLIIISFGLTLALAATPNNTYVFLARNKINIVDPTQSYDASKWFIENIYETLISYKNHDAKEFAPLLTTSLPIISKNGLTYTFNLRQRVKFHTSNVMDCKDVLYTFRRMLVVGNDESAAWFLRDSLLNVTNVEEIKKLTWKKIENAVICKSSWQVVFNLPKPDATFLAKIAFPANGIIDSKHAIKIGEWGGTEKHWRDWIGHDLHGSSLEKNQSGTGAYRLVQQSADSVIFKRFDDYWGGKPKLENIIIRYVPEESARITALINGEADETFIPPIKLDQLKNTSVKVIRLPSATESYVILMNQKIAPDSAVLGSGKLDGQGIPANFFSDIDIRKAFSYSFSQEDYLKETLNGEGAIRTMVLPETFLGYDQKTPRYKFDGNKAIEHFKKAWSGKVWEKGFIINAYYTSEYGKGFYLEFLKKTIEGFNPKFRINLQPKSFYDLVTEANQRKVALLDAGWAPDYPDPDNFFYTFYHSNGYYGKWHNYNNATVDKLIEKAKMISNPAERKKLYGQIGKIAYDDSMLILLPANSAYVTVQRELQGYEKNYNQMLAGIIYWKDLSK